MTTEPGRARSTAPTSVVVAKILAVGASAGSMLLLMAAMAVGQQPSTSKVDVVPAPEATDLTVGQDSPEGGQIGSSVSRAPQVSDVPGDAAPTGSRPSWYPPKATTGETPKATPAKPAPTPSPKPVVRSAPVKRAPDATSRAS